MKNGKITKVKLTNYFPQWPLVRQTSGQSGVWGNTRFFINQDIEECDYWVVFEGLNKEESAICPKENTVFISGEPPTIKSYKKKFLAQFETIITCHKTTGHPNAVLSQQALPWHVGRHELNGKNMRFSKDYDELVSITDYEKTGLISVVISDKCITEGHKTRLEFVNRLKEHFGDKICIYGRGIRNIPDKWDAVYPCKYHIAMENSCIEHYWTEKLSDAFLGGAYVFYYGCPNIKDYFPEGGLTPIDIAAPDKAVEIIEREISDNRYEKSLKEIKEAKNLILNKYNLFPMIADLINNRREICNPPSKITLKPMFEIIQGSD